VNVRVAMLALASALLSWVLLAPASAYAQSQSIHGTLRAPGGTPVAEVTIAATRNGVEIGKDTTARDGTWEIPLPGPGHYPVQFGAGDWITVITRVTGTFTGEMALPDGTVVPPTGKAFDVEFGQTVKWDGDRVIQIAAFWDAAEQARQIGLA
jgi:hypothetical protein